MYTCQKADEYIEKNRVDRADKPEFHLTTPVGWLNDPNGFSIYGGKAHLFYQFHPYSTEWGPMHWGHSTSDDFIRWEELPTALAPDSDYDAFGCFSGTAIENDGKHVLFYTGVVEEKLADGTKNVIQNQCMAVGDGISYEKISGNPVVDGKIMPEECSRADFRDPKVWKRTAGTICWLETGHMMESLRLYCSLQMICTTGNLNQYLQRMKQADLAQYGSAQTILRWMDIRCL